MCDLCDDDYPIFRLVLPADKIEEWYRESKL